jgi:hypothetical protein
MDKVSRPEMKQSDLKNQLADNIVNIAKEYVDDDEKYFPLGKNTFKAGIRVKILIPTCLQ